MEIDFYTARRRQLEKKAVSAALELLAFTRAAAAVLPIPATEPPIFLAIGEAEAIRDGVDDAGSEPCDPTTP